jgi:choline dehydrogenase-like flavoprotein
MSAAAGAAAVAPTGESHDLPGLWFADASVMPTSLKVNPMVTVMACARRVAGELAGALG